MYTSVEANFPVFVVGFTHLLVEEWISSLAISQRELVKSGIVFLPSLWISKSDFGRIQFLCPGSIATRLVGMSYLHDLVPLLDDFTVAFVSVINVNAE